MDKPPFLSGQGSSSASGSGNPPYESRPQKEGGSNKPDGASEKFPNRPQPMGAPKGNPESVPGGGKLPYKGPSVPTKSPMKLGK